MPLPEILVVDDEPANLQVVRRFLQDTRYVVTTAGSAQEALQAIDAHGPFDVYVLDVMMPEIRGTELADTIRTLQPGALVLYFTGFSDALFSGTRRLRDGEAFIQKPVTKRDVIEAISLLLYKDLRGPRE
jgi:CheY-like chemotaxis protein